MICTLCTNVLGQEYKLFGVNYTNHLYLLPK